MNNISWDEFQKVQIRVGTIVQVEDFPEARKPAYKLWIDFGPELGIKKSSAQITEHYNKESLVAKQVICVVNFPEKQIGPMVSQVLVTGLADNEGKVVLAVPDKMVPNGAKLF